MRERLSRRRRWTLLLVACGALLASAGVAYATIPDSSGQFHACVTSNGQVTIIDHDAFQNCKLGSQHVHWSGSGAPGPAGPAGPPGSRSGRSAGPSRSGRPGRANRAARPTGRDGRDGRDGSSGTPGRYRPSGASRSGRAAGRCRSAGSSRTQGEMGPQGATGAQGPQGPQGATGPQGPAGPTNVVVRQGLVANGSQALCNTGERATGGGGFVASGAQGLNVSIPVPSGTGQTPIGWFVAGESGAAVQAFVVCAS